MGIENADDYFKRSLEAIDDNLVLAYQNVAIQSLKKSPTIHTFESTRPLDIDEELYVTDFATNEALKPNLLGSWSIKIEGVTH